MRRQVLVTGASSGFGLETAMELAAAGFTTTALVPDEAGADQLHKEARSRGRSVQVKVADLAVPDDRQRVMDGLELYALVNNAGYLNAGLLQDVPLDEARRQFEVMVFAPVDLALRALPPMLERGEGRIVNVTSAAVHSSTPYSGWYQSAKAALRELADSLRLELDSTGIEVIDIEPGGFNTGIWDRARDELMGRKRTSFRPEAYDKPVELIDEHQSSMAAPSEVATKVRSILTSEGPRPHYRVGRDAGPLRAASELVPDRLWDRVVGRLSQVA